MQKNCQVRLRLSWAAGTIYGATIGLDFRPLIKTDAALRTEWS